MKMVTSVESSLVIYLLHISSDPRVVTFLIYLEGLFVYALYAICLCSSCVSLFGRVTSVIILENCSLLDSALLTTSSKQMTNRDIETCRKSTVLKWNFIGLILHLRPCGFSLSVLKFNFIGYISPIKQWILPPAACNLECMMCCYSSVMLNWTDIRYVG
jgi:hypothetical protein